MVITFFGHSDFKCTEQIKAKAYTLLCLEGQGKEVDFYLGNYGGFDNFAFDIAKGYKEKYPKSKLIFITPYIHKGYYKIEESKKYFDETVFPEIEGVPPIYAISKRNEWMIDQSNVVFFFVNRSWGGAAKALAYAKRRKKKIINLAE